MTRLDRSLISTARKPLICFLGVAGLFAATIPQAQAQPSAACNAVNVGAFELNITTVGPSTSSILTNWNVGETLTVSITSSDGISRSDGLFHGPTFAAGTFGALATTAVPTTGAVTFQHTITSGDLTNGIAVDPENDDSIVVACGGAPTVTGVSPNTGPPAGGTTVVITGTNFSVANTSVTVGGIAVTSFTVNSSTQITATVPPDVNGPENVIVSTLTGTSGSNSPLTYTYSSAVLTRTFVSSSGVDSNPCTISEPCASFAAAYSAVLTNGIVAALDPGKYGPLTITYPVTINGNGWAAITGTAQGSGIIINAGSGNVVLTGLEVDGAGAAYNGIVFNSGSSLTVDNCIVKDFISNNGTSGNGIMIAPTFGTIDFTIVNTIAVNNGSAGIHYLPASGLAAAIGAIDRVTATNNVIGIAVDLSAASGGSAAVTISNSVANNNSSDGIVTASATGTVIVTVDRDQISGNGTGVGVGANTTVLLSRSVIAKNTTYGISNSGTAGSSADNRIAGNGSSDIHGTGLTSVAQQ
jgi:large repetitive protein